MFPPQAMVEWVLVMLHHFLLFYERTMSYQKFMRFKASPQALLNWLEIELVVEFPKGLVYSLKTRYGYMVENC